MTTRLTTATKNMGLKEAARSCAQLKNIVVTLECSFKKVIIQFLKTYF
jgi:hypothetical protein